MTTARPLPRCVQISEALIREIAAGVLADGMRLPTEKAMAAQFDVAVGTLRKSLAILEGKGLLERVQGSGNYIRAKHNIESVYRFFRLELLKGGGLPSAEIISLSVAHKEQGFPDFGTALTAHRIIRLRYLDDILIALEDIWLDMRFTPELNISDVSESLYAHYKTALSLLIARVEDKVSFQPVPDWAPRGFNMKRGAQAGFIQRTGWDQWGRAAEYSRTWFNPNHCAYVSRT